MNELPIENLPKVWSLTSYILIINKNNSFERSFYDDDNIPLCRKIISSWLKKPTFEIFLYFLMVFSSSFIIQAGNRLRRTYKQTTTG